MKKLSYLYFKTRKQALKDLQIGTNTVKNNQLELFSKS